MANPAGINGTSTKHGHASRARGCRPSPTYYTWVGMVRRCTEPSHQQWDDYGGRGITVCDRWLVFENFLADVGDRPVGLTLDRVKNDRGYEPGNTKWSTPLEQARNRRRRETWVSPHNIEEILGRLEHGESQKSIAHRLGLNASTISKIRTRNVAS